MNSNKDRLSFWTDLIYERSDKSFNKGLLADFLSIAIERQFDEQRSTTQQRIQQLITDYIDSEDLENS
jgi:hypothetical protein